MSKLTQILTAIKIGTAVGKTILTGKTAKTLEKVEQGAELAEKIKEMFPTKKGQKNERR